MTATLISPETLTDGTEALTDTPFTLSWLGRTATGRITRTPDEWALANPHGPSHDRVYYFQPESVRTADGSPDTHAIATWIVKADIVEAALAATLSQVA